MTKETILFPIDLILRRLCQYFGKHLHETDAFRKMLCNTALGSSLQNVVSLV